MDLRNLLFGGAALGVLAACWQHLKSFAWRIAGREVVVPLPAVLHEPGAI